MRPALPIDAHLDAIAESLARCPSLVLEAPPGAGKTTRVPPLLLDAGLAGSGRVLVLEPRRVAARAAARRIAAERGGAIGDEIGWQVRFEDRTSAATRLVVMTEGILTRRLQADPLLEGVGAVVLDEVHERSLHTDLGLAMLREVQSAREDLRIVAMSATLDAAPMAALLGCPTMRIAGRAHPVELRYDERPDERRLEARIASAVGRALRETCGHILAFLPGSGEIRRSIDACAGICVSHDVLLLPLHGSLGADEQDRALGPSSRRKVIFATNIAETSITIDGVDTVIDSGLERVNRHDARHGIDRLVLSRISRASSEQRAGRAGRQGPGVVYRLWTAGEQATLVPSQTPEIQRVDLTATVLELRAWGVRDLHAFGWLEPPPEASLARAEHLLRLLGAVGDDGHPTPLGRDLLRIPLHPRLGCMLVAAHAQGCVRDGAALLALASEPDIVRDRERLAHEPTGPSDLLLRLERLAAVERAGFDVREAERLSVDARAARSVARVRDRLAETAVRVLGRHREARPDEDTLLRLLLAGFADRVCRRRAPRSDRALMVGGHGVAMDRASVVRDAELFIAVELGGPPTGVRAETQVRTASAISPEWLAKGLPHAVQERDLVAWDEARGAVFATRQVLYGDLALSERPLPKVAPALIPEASRLLALAASAAPLATLAPSDEALRLLSRISSLSLWRPELGLPRCDEDGLRALLPALCEGRRSLAELRALDLPRAVRGLLTREQLRSLDTLAPDRLEVPSGSHVRLAYREAEPPVLAVRLQEMFGLRENPTVNGGRLPVVLHLLSPAMRPVQVTSDIAGFWARTWPEVRKELRGRYPKHDWPMDPLVAPPRRRPARKT